MKDIPIDSPFYSFHEWRDKTQNSTRFDTKNDVWLGLYLARKFDVRFVIKPDFSYDGMHYTVQTMTFSDLNELERFFATRTVALMQAYQNPSQWAFSRVSQTTYAVEPLDIPVVVDGGFAVVCVELKERDGV